MENNNKQCQATIDEKCTFYDHVEKSYFGIGFGSMTKSDVEIFLFTEFYNLRRNHNDACDDYSLSHALGITQTKVRSLKELMVLRDRSYNPDSYLKEFVDALNKARIGKDKEYIEILIEEVNVMTEIRHVIEQNGWFDNCKLNKKVLSITPECFWDLCEKKSIISSNLSPETKKAIVDKFGTDKNDKSMIRTFLEEPSSKGFVEFIKKASWDIAKNVIVALIVMKVQTIL